MNKNATRQKKGLIAFNLLNQQLVKKEIVLNSTVGQQSVGKHKEMAAKTKWLSLHKELQTNIDAFVLRLLKRQKKPHGSIVNLKHIMLHCSKRMRFL